ncbi:MAG: FtsQ-type POTRA domain-containing protein [Chloroflexaceae bacterium]|nr:FtsQ-type POTRA domain-containing protein [Chloroflexaceae bacterium]
MDNLITLSSEQWQSRRQALLNRRRSKLWQSLWRSAIATAFVGGLFWSLALPQWAITKKEQIAIEGNQLLSDEEIQSLLPLNYPQPVLQLQTQQLSQQLQQIAPLERVEIARQGFPSRLILTVQERPPAAIVTTAPGDTTVTGYLDEKGIVVPGDFYAKAGPKFQRPTLKVIGFAPQHRAHWVQLYPLVRSAKVPIAAIDWRDPGNLILLTDLGSIHLGADASRLPAQLTTLARLKTLPKQIDGQPVAYIDLTNPDLPEVQIR